MAFAGNFSVSQGSDISAFTLTDTSTDYDGSITTRTIYPTLIDGTILGGAAVDWPIDSGAGDTITLDILNKDYSLNVIVVWSVPSPELGGVYTKACIFSFTGYSSTFIYGIIQQMGAQSTLTVQTNFLQSLYNAQCFVNNAIYSTDFSDQYNAQSNLDRVYYMEQNQTLFF